MARTKLASYSESSQKIRSYVSVVVFSSTALPFEFQEFSINVENGRLSWFVHRRYSEFDALHSQLLEAFGASISMPAFPGKYYGSHSQKVLEERRDELHAYLQSVLEISDVVSSLHFLKFIGILNDNSLENEAGALKRQVFHIDKAMKLFEAGDIILFRSDFALSALQRSVTFSDYDHAAIVVRFASKDRTPSSLYLLEATGEGVHTYDLRRRLFAWNDVKASMVFRKLIVPEHESDHIVKLVGFRQTVDGLQYGYVYSLLFLSFSIYMPCSLFPFYLRCSYEPALPLFQAASNGHFDAKECRSRS